MSWRHDNQGSLRARRFYVFRTLLATRATAGHPDHVAALNLVEVDFHGVAEIMAAWRAYMNLLSSGPAGPTKIGDEQAFNDRRTDLLAPLIRKMAQHLGYGDLSEIDIKRGGYAPSMWMMNEHRVAAMQEGITRLVSGETVLKVRPEPPPGS